MDAEKKLKLQHRAQKGIEAEDVRLKFFGEKYLETAEREALRGLSRSMTYEEFVSVREQYTAAVKLVESLVAIARDGKQAAKRLKEAMANESD